jgi:hypothetical protein
MEYSGFAQILRFRQKQIDPTTGKSGSGRSGSSGGSYKKGQQFPPKKWGPAESGAVKGPVGLAHPAAPKGPVGLAHLEAHIQEI